MAIEINIFGTVGAKDSETKDSVKKALDNAGGQDVIVNVSSSGGSVFDGLSIAGIIEQYGGKTIGKGIGIVASAATIILLAAKEKKMVKNSFFMLHNSWGGAEGNAIELERSVELLKKIDEQMAEIYTTQIERKGKLVDGDRSKTLANVKKMMEVETWLTPEEATDLGLIDGVIEEEKQFETIYEETFAQVRAEAKNFKNIPKKIAAMASEKKTLLEQMAIWLGLKAEITDETEVKAEAITEAKEEEKVIEQKVEEEKVEEKAEAKTDSRESEMEAKLADLQKKIENKQMELESVEAEIKAKINYKTEPKADQNVSSGFTQDQISQASAFINSLYTK
jgi:ATP-dependent protease ClpP protease subunit